MNALYRYCASTLLGTAILAVVTENAASAATVVYDNPVTRPYSQAQQSCTGLSPLPTYCMYPRYYKIQKITGTFSPAAINNNGHVVGTTVGSDNRWHAGSWVNGTITDLGMLGCKSTVTYCQSRALGVNDTGQVVGDSSTFSIFSPYYPHAFIWSSGKMSGLAELGGEWSTAMDINGNGIIVGYGRAGSDYLEHGWINIGGVLTQIGNYGESSRANAVNEANQVTGVISIGGQRKGFFYKDGTLTVLGTFGLSGSVAYDVGDTSTPNVVGSSVNSSSRERGFLWRPGSMFDLGVLPEADTSVARAVNNRSQIVGQSGSKAVIWQNGTMRNINQYLNGFPVAMIDALDVNNVGKILARGADGFYLLDPQY